MARYRLVCFPYAGAGAAAFRGWGAAAPPQLEVFAVQSPGREDAASAPPFETWRAYIDAGADALGRLPPGRVAVYGHSLGALAALDVAAAASRAGVDIAGVFVAARPWPGRPDATAPSLDDADSLSDDALAARLANVYGDQSPGLAHADVRAVAAPVLRADIRLLRQYAYNGPARLAAPLTAYAGARDPITSAADLDAWRAETLSGFRMRIFDGGHFFLNNRRDEILADIASQLETTS